MIIPKVQAQKPASFAELTRRIQDADKASDLVSVTTIGLSVEGRELWMVRLSPRDKKLAASPPALVYARQHGNEPAGQEAALEWMEAVAAGQETVPFPVLLVPCINPDGSERNDRRNANRMDLNRDHLILSQPETQALHRVLREVKPRVAVDCHEFGRDSSDYTAKGWSEWPQIMVDCANYPHPVLEGNYQRSVRAIERISQTMTSEGINTSRYVVGDAPPEGEVRHSTVEVDDGRNSMGLYGIPSYIIESGLYRNSEDSNSDMANRVKAYRRLLALLMDDTKDLPIQPVTIPLLPEHRLLATNNFWGMANLKMDRSLPVIDQASSRTLRIPAPRFMADRITKLVVPIPKVYAVVPGNEGAYKDLLTRHGLKFEVLDKPLVTSTVQFRLEEIQRETDPLYQRFGGRQITAALPSGQETLPAGTLLVRTDGSDALRIAVVLDPRMLYGLYQHRTFQEKLESGGIVPVRIAETN